VRTLATALAIVLAAGLALSALADVTTGHQKADVKLQQSGPFDKDKVVAVKLGTAVKVELELRIGDFFDKTTVYANGKATNSGEKPAHFQLYVAFLDKDGKLVCAAGEDSFDDEGIAPGKDDDIGQMIMTVPKGAAKTITSYRAVLYEGPVEIGKE
jgi:hypothetical protein